MRASCRPQLRRGAMGRFAPTTSRESQVMLRKTLLVAALMASAAVARAEDAPALEVTIYNDDLALVQDARQLDIAKGRQRLEFKDVSVGDPAGDGGAGGRRRRHRRAELRLRPPDPLQADGEGGGPAGADRAHQPRQRPAGDRDRHRACRQRGRRAEDRRPHRGAARRRRADPGDLRQGAGQPARPADAVGDGRLRPRRRAAGDAQLPDHRALAGRPTTSLCSTRRRPSSTCRAGSR